MTIRKFAHGSVSDVSGTEETVSDVNTAQPSELDSFPVLRTDARSEGDNSDGNDADTDDYRQSN